MKMNLQLFAEGGEGGEGGSEGGNEDTSTNTSTNSSDGNEGSDNGSTEPSIPKHRFDEVNEALKETQKQLKAIQDAKKEEEIEAQKKKGEFETLYNEANETLESTKANLEATSERVEALEGVINGLLEQKLESIDEQYHDLVPEGMTPEQKLSWISNAEAKGLFAKNDKSEETLGGRTNGGSTNKVDISNMTPHQMFASAFGGK